METKFIKSSDGTRLRIGHSGVGDAHVLIVPGLAEHMGRYGHVAEALVSAGWKVTIVELRGHGESGGKKGHVNRWQEYIDDVRAVAAEVGEPLVLLGHSMGGLVALDAAIEGIGPEIRAMALSDPNIAVAVHAPAIKVMGAKMLSKVMPGISLSNELDVNTISRDPEVVKAYEADPLVYSTITPRWYTEMVASQHRVVSHAGDYAMPLLMMLGEGDVICDWKASEALARNWGGPAETKRYPELFHEIFNEPEKEQVLADLTTWLEQHKT